MRRLTSQNIARRSTTQMAHQTLGKGEPHPSQSGTHAVLGNPRHPLPCRRSEGGRREGEAAEEGRTKQHQTSRGGKRGDARTKGRGDGATASRARNRTRKTSPAPLRMSTEYGKNSGRTMATSYQGALILAAEWQSITTDNCAPHNFRGNLQRRRCMQTALHVPKLDTTTLDCPVACLAAAQCDKTRSRPMQTTTSR